MSGNGMPSKPHQAVPPKASTPPNQTLYIRNLNDRVAKPDLRRALFTLFSTYGHILDVVALKTQKMRGQAHIVFRDVQSSTQAMQSLQGFEFLGREMMISYGKGRSNIISKLDGSVKPTEPPKPPQQPTADARKPNVIAPAANTARPAPPPTGSLKPPNGVTQDGSKSPQGMKRPREEESEDDEPMQEDDEGEAMEVSDED